MRQDGLVDSLVGNGPDPSDLRRWRRHLANERAEAAVARAIDADDVIIAAAGAIREAQAGAAAKGRPLTPAAALDPKALDRLTTMAVARLDAM